MDKKWSIHWLGFNIALNARVIWWDPAFMLMEDTGAPLSIISVMSIKSVVNHWPGKPHHIKKQTLRYLKLPAMISKWLSVSNLNNSATKVAGPRMKPSQNNWKRNVCNFYFLIIRSFNYKNWTNKPDLKFGKCFFSIKTKSSQACLFYCFPRNDTSSMKGVFWNVPYKKVTGIEMRIFNSSKVDTFCKQKHAIIKLEIMDEHYSWEQVYRHVCYTFTISH